MMLRGGCIEWMEWMVVTEITVHLEMGPDDPMCPESSATRCLPARSLARSFVLSRSLALSFSLSLSLPLSLSLTLSLSLSISLSISVSLSNGLVCRSVSRRLEVLEALRCSFFRLVTRTGRRTYLIIRRFAYVCSASDQLLGPYWL